jgi:hypothetical protein
LAVEAECDAERGVTESDPPGDNRVEGRLEVGRRTGDDSQNLGGRRLLFEGLGEVAVLGVEFLEQANIFDRDDRLVGEGAE